MRLFPTLRIAIKALDFQSAYPYNINQNYVRTYIPLKAISTSNCQNISIEKEDVRMYTQYLDGLGRVCQNVWKEASPKGFDVVQPVEYDLLGRQTKDHLPYPSYWKSGAFQLPNLVQNAQKAYYGSIYPGEAEYAHNLRVFENSPLNEVVAEYGPGKNWRTAGKSVKYKEKTNVAQSIPIFRNTTFKGYYAQGQLVSFRN